jgi:hypothetical protein
MKMVFVLALAASLAGGLTGCRKGAAPGSDNAGAKEVLAAFTKSGADPAALTAALRPKPADYDAVFVTDAVPKVKAALEPIWDSPKAVIKPADDQTQVELVSATPDQLAKGNVAGCPEGYKDIADKLDPKVIVYCGSFVKKGEKLGLSVDALVYVNDHWALFPKAFRALR